MNNEITFLAVRVTCADPMDRSEYIPLDKVARIRFNADGSDTILDDAGHAHICYDGEFSITEIGGWYDNR